MQDDSLIDLHIHSTASDGSLSPRDILALAKKSGVDALSVTDHDTINGVKSLLRSTLPNQPEFISGVEISCEPPEKFKHLGSIHLLGYGFSVYDKTLNTILDNARMARSQRNPKIIEKLNSFGFDISMEEVRERFGAVQTGRPHIAELLKEKGYVASFREAFDKYMGKGKPAYVDKYKVSLERAIHCILNAGGVPVLAHPGLLEFHKNTEFEEFLDELIRFGLLGMEVYYTNHDEQQTEYYRRFAIDKNLLITGGSDFHGMFNSGVELGKGRGNLNIDSSLYAELKNRVEEVRKEYTQPGILEQNIGYKFTDQSLLNNALCHRSFLNENQDVCDTDNERLEFLGDAVLGLCIGQQLMEKSPEKNEGELSKLRANLVSEPALADMARFIDLGRFIWLGKGEALSRGNEKNSILSDAFEALIGAVYLDGGFENIYTLTRDLFEKNLGRLLSNSDTIDYKSMLQEYVQERGEAAPHYQVLKETGPDHDKTFEISVSVFDVESKGTGKTKKAAEQASAKQILEQLKQLDP